MNLKCSVEDTIFRNPDNGYSVIAADSDGQYVTVVGMFPPVAPGELLELEGEWKRNSRFGEQFCADKIKVLRPDKVEAVERYLCSGLFPGVGETTAAAIVGRFGAETLDIIENSPAKLAQVRGISVKKASAIGEIYQSLHDMQDTILFLQEYEVGLNLALKIYKKYDAATRRVVEKNPYQLIDDVPGVGFITADRIAEKLGVEPDSRFRVSAAIGYVLSEAAEKSGHTYLPKAVLCEKVEALLKLERIDALSLIGDIVDDSVVMGRAVVVETDEGESVMQAQSFLLETSIARLLTMMMRRGKPLDMDVNTELSDFERACALSLHEGQIAAIKNCVNFGVNVITGGPGTGKTTIIRCIINILRNNNMKCCLCAPTGRAAKRLSQATGEDAKTIHRLLDLDFTDGKGYFTFNEQTKLEADVIIVDEVSMCDEYVFDALVKAIPAGGRLILVGDKDQLPSVGAGNVLADIIASECIPVNYLTQIYRQGEGSNIVINAHRINEGKLPIIDNRAGDFFFEEKIGADRIAENVVSLVTKRLPAYAKTDPREIQVLCPMKKGVAGVENMNILLQNALNPPTGQALVKIGNREFRVGDKIIHTVNDYQMEWVNPREDASGSGVYNGDIGHILDIDVKTPALTVQFEDGKIVKYLPGDFDKLTLAYAVSVHKSQGSEFDVVVLAITGGNYMIMTRNLLYTAVTRAKKIVVVTGGAESLQKMVSNNFTVRRMTFLSRFLRETFFKIED